MGSLGKFNQLRWDLESKFKINSGHYSVLRTSREGRSAEKRILFSENIYYDYANKRITFTRVKGADGIPEQTIFPLTNPTTDYATLFHFMQNEINWEKRTNCSFYLVTSKPSLEKINVKFLSREKISTGQEAINALKVQLIFDQGILDNLFAGFIPSTFIWVEDQPPYRWIKYEGPELGDSATIIRIERQKLIP